MQISAWLHMIEDHARRKYAQQNKIRVHVMCIQVIAAHLYFLLPHAHRGKTYTMHTARRWRPMHAHLCCLLASYATRQAYDIRTCEGRRRIERNC